MRLRIRSILIAGFVIASHAIAGDAFAADRYVHSVIRAGITTGLPLNDCFSSLNPCETIGRVHTATSNDDVLVIASDFHTTLVATKMITIQGRNAAESILKRDSYGLQGLGHFLIRSASQQMHARGA